MPLAAQPAPASDYARLLDTRFFAERGTFGFNSPKRGFVLFHAQGLDPYQVTGQYVVREAESGRVVGRQMIGSIIPSGSAVISMLGTQGPDQWDGALEAGTAYRLEVEFEGDLIGSVPFTVAAQDSGDPFDPTTTYALEGPWRTHAYFSHETERPDYRMHFNAWVGADEAPTNQSVEVSVRRDGAEVAFGYAYANPRYGWGEHLDFPMLKAEARDPQGRFARSAVNPASWRIEDVTPGPYELVLSTEAGPFRTLSVEGASGAFVPHARSAVDYEPRAHFLTPRKLAGQNLDRAHTLYWIAPPVE